MQHDHQTIRVSANGRMSIPAKQRKALGIEGGGTVVATVQEGELRIRSVKAVLDEISALVGPVLKAAGETVDQFIADRHADAAREEQEYRDYLKERQTWRQGRQSGRS